MPVAADRSGSLRRASRVAIGTDSLASVPRLNLFDELAAVRRFAPSVPAARILQSATPRCRGARIRADLGSLAPGPGARCWPLPPAGRDDVEEYLVSGVPAQI